MDKQNVKTETEKMLAGEIYDPMEKDLVSLRQRAHRLSKEYNECLETDEKREQILDELMPNRGKMSICKARCSLIMVVLRRWARIPMRILTLRALTVRRSQSAKTYLWGRMCHS